MFFLAIIINTNQGSLVNATFAAALSSSHYPGETVIRIDSYPAGGLFLALTQHYYRMRHWSMPKMAKNLGLFAARG